MKLQRETLPHYQLTASDMITEAMAMPLDVKVTQAIALLRHWEPYALKVNPTGYALAFSGGKDSQCIYELARMAGVAHTCHYSVTTLDPPELVRFIQREYPEATWIRQPRALLTRLMDGAKGPPTRLMRWCCEEYKEQGGNDRWKIIGVRAAESKRREGLWKQMVPHRRYSTGIVCPILYWTDADVWALHRQRGLRHCCLYDEGFKRLGCIGCPLAGPAQVKREFARWPGYARNWEVAVKAYWERWHDVPRLDGNARYVTDFPTPESFWQWWLSGVARGTHEGCQGSLLFSDQPAAVLVSHGDGAADECADAATKQQGDVK